jgi:hypothetical protein
LLALQPTNKFHVAMNSLSPQRLYRSYTAG